MAVSGRVSVRLGLLAGDLRAGHLLGAQGPQELVHPATEPGMHRPGQGWQLIWKHLDNNRAETPKTSNYRTPGASDCSFGAVAPRLDRSPQRIFSSTTRLAVESPRLNRSPATFASIQQLSPAWI